MHTPPDTPLSSAIDANHLYRKMAWRLLPLLMLAYLVAYLDRVNIGYAQLQMKDMLHFSDAIYGIGAGIFFVGYFLCEVPSNLLLARIGARKTLLRIMVCWGLIAAAMMWIRTPMQFYVMRFALGVFEAGFFPGVLLYLTYWFPAQRRGKVIALFASAPVVASLVSGPLCGAILHSLDQVGGLAGWQWLFVLQGLPAVLLGLVVWFYLDDQPQKANWLSDQEKQLIAQQHQADADHQRRIHSSRSKLFSDPGLYALALINFLLIGGSYALVFWVPSLIKSWGIDNPSLIGWYAALPNLIGVVGMIIIGRHSDRQRERRWHYAFCVVVAALGLGLTIAAHAGLALSLLGMSIALIGIATTTPLFMTVVTEYFPRSTAAAGIAIVTSTGVLGGAASAAATGQISNRFGPGATLYLVIVLFLLSGALLLASTSKKPAGAAATSTAS